MTLPVESLTGVLADLSQSHVAADLAAATIAAVALARTATGRHRLLLSGSLTPALTHAVTAAFPAGAQDIEVLAPDPLAIEDLFGRLDEDLAALVVQTPDPFGACRGFETLAVLCREFEVPLVVVVADPRLLGRDGLPQADLVVVGSDSPRFALVWSRPGFPGAASMAPEAVAAGFKTGGLQASAAQVGDDTARLVARLRRMPGVRVVTRDPFATVAIHLGDARRAEECLPSLPGLVATPLSRLYPGWPELEPVLALTLTAPLDETILARLRFA